MALSTLTARVSAKDKAAFDVFCNSVGLNTSTAINIFVKKVLDEQRIPFEICAPPKADDPFYSEENMERLRKSAEEIKQGKYTIRELIEVD